MFSVSPVMVGRVTGLSDCAAFCAAAVVGYCCFVPMVSDLRFPLSLRQTSDLLQSGGGSYIERNRRPVMPAVQ